MINFDEIKKNLIKKAKAMKDNIADFDISQKEIESHLVEISRIIKLNDKCIQANDINHCPNDGYHQILSKDANGKIFIKPIQCSKLKDNPIFLIKNNYLYRSVEASNDFQRLQKDFIWTDEAKYQKRVNFLNYLIEIKKANKLEKGCYVYGNVSSGKSYLLTCFCNEMAILNHSIIYINMSSFALEIKKSIAENNSFKDEIIEQMMYCDILVLDELGFDVYKDYLHNQILYPIINYRMNVENKMTLFSSQYSISDLMKNYKMGLKENKSVEQFINRIERLTKDRVFNISMPKTN